VGADVTERKRADEDLLWKTAFLEAQTNSTGDGILIIDPNGRGCSEQAVARAAKDSSGDRRKDRRGSLREHGKTILKGRAARSMRSSPQRSPRSNQSRRT